MRAYVLEQHVRACMCACVAQCTCFIVFPCTVSRLSVSRAHVYARACSCATRWSSRRAADCPLWHVEHHVRREGGVALTGDVTLRQCRSACLDADRCYAVDFSPSPSNATRGSCTLHDVTGDVTSADASTSHHRVVSRDCADDGEGEGS